MSASIRKSVQITGCFDGGINSGLVETFQERGYHVFAALRNLTKLSPRLSAEAAKIKENRDVKALQLDVLSSDSIAAAVTSAFAPLLIQARGCLVNNASVSAYVPMPFSGA
ncbi:hypothetical protein PG993_013038 [Apiospora rasikravindrae]|uniref:Uncharacterized protein n=1 Tax=Apiospora rasikravindrae TaxID=990691 RepID=A0ABR1RWH6_9PEZI